MTVRAKPIFKVKEYAEGQPWICVEYWDNEPGMPMGTFGFDLAPETTLQKAQEVAKFMNDNLEQFSFTKL